MLLPKEGSHCGNRIFLTFLEAQIFEWRLYVRKTAFSKGSDQVTVLLLVLITYKGIALSIKILYVSTTYWVPRNLYPIMTCMIIMSFVYPSILLDEK